MYVKQRFTAPGRGKVTSSAVLPCSRAMLIVPCGEVRLELLDEAGSSLGQRTLSATRRSQTLSW